MSKYCFLYKHFHVLIAYFSMMLQQNHLNTCWIIESSSGTIECWRYSKNLLLWHDVRNGMTMDLIPVKFDSQVGRDIPEIIPKLRFHLVFVWIYFLERICQFWVQLTYLFVVFSGDRYEGRSNNLNFLIPLFKQASWWVTYQNLSNTEY